MAAAPVSTITLKGLIAFAASQIFDVNKLFAFGELKSFVTPNVQKIKNKSIEQD